MAAKKPATQTAPANGGLKLTNADAAADLAGTQRPDNHLTEKEKADRYGWADNPTVSEESTKSPTVDEARAMFEARPDLSSVMTEEGELFRDGSFGARKTLGLDGIWR